MYDRKITKLFCCSLLAISLIFVSSSCQQPKSEVPQAPSTTEETAPAGPEAVKEQAESGSSPAGNADPGSSFLIDKGKTIEERILTPDGYTRIPSDNTSFATFIRNYELKPDQSPVLLYDGTEKSDQGSHVAVFSMALSDRDLQQCADSVIRLYAEYFYHTGQTERMKFHFVDGFSCDYDQWKQGYRVTFSNDKASWAKTAAPKDDPETLESYLTIVFAYASTLSLAEESQPVDMDEVAIGDIFIKAGSPGHVVLVADLCENKEGKRAFLLAQGFMPAQEFHIIKNPAHPADPWYYADEITFPFQTQSYTFPEGSLMRPAY